MSATRYYYSYAPEAHGSLHYLHGVCYACKDFSLRTTLDVLRLSFPGKAEVDPSVWWPVALLPWQLADGAMGHAEFSPVYSDGKMVAALLKLEHTG